MGSPCHVLCQMRRLQPKNVADAMSEEEMEELRACSLFAQSGALQYREQLMSIR